MKIRQKGSFGKVQLPIAGTYVIPISRRRMLFYGLLAITGLLAYVTLDFFMAHGRFLSNGPLTSGHAALEQDCANCHVEYAAVPDESCSSCHEQTGNDLGVYSFSSHYLYRSEDFQRVVPHESELPCSSCHPEHEGRDAPITHVPDERCLTCHPFGSFNTEHPAFEAVTRPERAGLNFPHAFHTAEVLTALGTDRVEESCLHCHEPEEDGRTFKPISFDASCDACHLTTSQATPRLPIHKPDAPGVLTLEMIQQQRMPGDLWAFYTNPNEFRTVGSRLVSKSPLHHRDPWVLANLRRLRKMAHPKAGLADLLQASPHAPPHALKTLYHEAIATLEGYLLELRSRPEAEVQEDLNHIESLLQDLKQGLDDPYLPLDETGFLLALEETSPDLDPDTLSEIQSLADDLTEPCRTCHILDDLTIRRVQKDQRTLRRADFNHKAHILQRRCLDCHHEFGNEDFDGIIDGTLQPADLKARFPNDHASVVNLPDIESCKSCHTPALAANNCITCHDFHPDRDRHAHLLVEEAPQ